MQHRTTWHTNGSVRTAGYVRLGECSTLAYQPIHIGSAYVFITQCMDRVVALIIGKQNKDIRFSHSIFVVLYLSNETLARFSPNHPIVLACRGSLPNLEGHDRY